MIFNSNKKIKNNLELVSLHIPKTAGTSFRNSLKTIYGEAGAQRLDIFPKPRNVFVEELPFTGKKLPNEMEVIHGHFHLDHLFEQFKIEKDIPIITWMRDPVERVISNYYYLEKRLKEELDEASKGLNILEKMQRNLMEYARADVNRNVQARYIANFPLSDFKFIGIVEYYESELNRLQQSMQWDQITHQKVNVTGIQRAPISTAWTNEIKALNHEDVALYQEALSIRNTALNL